MRSKAEWVVCEEKRLAHCLPITILKSATELHWNKWWDTEVGSKMSSFQFESLFMLLNATSYRLDSSRSYSCLVALGRCFENLLARETGKSRCTSDGLEPVLVVHHIVQADRQHDMDREDWPFPEVSLEETRPDIVHVASAKDLNLFVVESGYWRDTGWYAPHQLHYEDMAGLESWEQQVEDFAKC